MKISIDKSRLQNEIDDLALVTEAAPPNQITGERPGLLSMMPFAIA
jgi:hypothetical protein